MAGDDYPIPPLPSNPSEAMVLLEKASEEISEAYVKMSQVHIYIGQLLFFYQQSGYNEPARGVTEQAVQMSEDLNDPMLKLMSDIRELVGMLSRY